jgi:hypothetical protein
LHTQHTSIDDYGNLNDDIQQRNEVYVMNIRKNILWITRAAVLTALLVTVQFITAPLGNQFVTGTAGNLIMIVALLTCGLATGLTVAIISPLCAFLVGVGSAFPPLIPFIALGNAALILTWFTFGLLNKSDKSSVRYKLINCLIVLTAAIIKFLTLYVGIVKIALPLLLNLNEKQSAMLTLSFSYPQIITATIGGLLTLVIVPPIQKALKSRTSILKN